MSALTISKALEIAKANHDPPSAVLQKLESANTEVWQKIQAQPTTYVMDKYEFGVLNYFQERHKNDPRFGQAVARFWRDFDGDPSEVDGQQASSSSNKDSTR